MGRAHAGDTRGSPGTRLHPPIETVKNSSTFGPMPSSGVRTDCDRAMPAKKKSGFAKANGARWSRVGSGCVEGARRARSRLLILLQAGGAGDDGDGGLGGNVLAEDGGLLLPRDQDHAWLHGCPLVEVGLPLASLIVRAQVSPVLVLPVKANNLLASEAVRESSKLVRIYEGVDHNLPNPRHRLVPGHLRAGEVAVPGTGVRLKVSGRDHGGRACASASRLPWLARCLSRAALSGASAARREKRTRRGACRFAGRPRSAPRSGWPARRPASQRRPRSR